MGVCGWPVLIPVLLIEVDDGVDDEGDAVRTPQKLRCRWLG